MNGYFIGKGKKNLVLSILILLAAAVSFFIGSLLAMSDDANDTSVASAYTTSGNKITTEAQFKALRNTSTSGYLANDITLTNTTGYNSSQDHGTTAYSGTLYGNGKTITINMAYELYSISDSSTHTVGLLFSFLSGTVRDCTIVLKGNISLYEYTSSNNNYRVIMGIICGQLQNGTITNLNVIVDGAFNFIGRDTGSVGTPGGALDDKGGTGTQLGGFAGLTTGGTISNCNLINNNIIYGGAEDDHGNDDEGTTTRVCVGGFVGEVDASKTLNMTNIALNGAAGSIICANSGVSGHNAIRAGGIIGQVRDSAKVYITGLDYKYKGYVIARNGERANFIVGRAWNNTTIAVNGVVFSNYVWAHAFSNTSKLTRQSMITPMNFGSTGFNGVWDFNSGFASGMTHVWALQPDNIIAKMVGGIVTGYTITNAGFDDGSVDYIIYNNASETAQYTVLAFDGNSNNMHDIDTLNGLFSGLNGSQTYNWNSAGFNVRLQMGLGTQSPLNTFGGNLNIYGNEFNKTLYIRGDAKASGAFLFNLGPSYRSPVVEFNVNASSAGFPIVDTSNTAGGSIKITGGSYTGDVGSGVLHIIGVTPLTVTGGTITSTMSSGGFGVLLSGAASGTFSNCTVTANGGRAISSESNGALSISGGTYNGAYSVYYASTVSSFTLSSAPSLNGTTADIYAGKQITASGITGGAYTLTWAGSTSNGTTVVSGSSQTSKFTLTNSGRALYASGSNIKIGKVSTVTYHGVTSTGGLVTSYIESQAKTLTAPGSSNIAAGLTYVGMYTSTAFSTSISSISTSTTGTVNIFVKKTLNYSISASAASMTYGDGSITLSASTSADTSKLTYSWTKSSSAYSSAATVALSLVGDSGTYGLNLVYTETSGSYTLVSNGTASDKTITISKRQLTISGVDAVDRAFNNTKSVSLTGGTLVNYKDGDGTSGNSLLGFTRGSASISSAAAGTYTVSGINITLTGSKVANYQLTQPSGINVVISAKSLSTDLTIGTVSNVTYSGSSHTPKPQLSDSIQTLVENTDFNYSYSNNTNAGTATVTMTGKGNYKDSRSVNFTINTKNLSSGITVGAIADFYYSGDANTPMPALTYTIYSLSLTRGTSSSGDFWFTYSDNINAGTATLTANGRGNYSGTLSASFTILKADVSISVSGLSSLTYGQTLANSTISGTAVNTQESSVVVNGIWSFVLPLTTKPDVGTTAFSVSFTPELSANYNAPGNISANLTVSKCIPLLSGITASSVEYRREISTATISGNAKNNNDNTIVAGAFAFAAPAETAYNGAAYEVIFYPADTGRYLSATSSVTITVAPRLLSVTAFDAVDRIYDATTAITVFSYTLVGIYGAESVGIEARGAISYADASDTAYTVEITSFALAGEDKDNYYVNAYGDTINVMISPLTLAVSADNYSKTYGDIDPVFSKVIDSTTADGNLIILFGRDITGTDKENIGTYDFNSVQLETPDPNYNIVFSENGGKDKFVINPYTLTVTANTFNKTYGEADPAFTEDFVGAYDEIINVTYTREAGNNARVYSFTSVILTEPNANYTVSFSANGGKDKFVITPYALTVTASAFSKIYGEADPAFTGDFTGAYDETINVTYTRDSGKDAGVYNFTSVTQTEPNANYTVSFSANGGKDKFTISPYALTVTASTFNKSYGEADPVFSEDFTGAYDETVNVTYTREAGKDVRAYSFVSVTLTEPNANYTVVFAENGGKDKFVITPYALTVTASAFSKIYGEADPAFTGDFNGAYDETVNVTYTREAGNNARVYSFTSVILTEPNANYTVSFSANGGKDKFIITPYALTVTANTFNKTYGEADPAFTEDFTGAYDETVSVTYTREAGNNARVYSFTSVILTEPNANYTVSFSENGGKDKFIITPYALTVTANTFNKTYGEADPAFNGDFNGAYDEIVNVTYTREAGKDIGTYSFVSVTLTEPNANYTVVFAENGGKDKFIITPYALTVTANTFNKTYGEADPAFTGDFNGAYDEIVNVTYTREAGKDIGTYSFVSVTLTEPNANYTVVFAENGGKDKFIITPYALTVTANTFNKTYGEADPAFNGDFNGAYDEIVNVTYTREAGKDIGTYSFVSVTLTEPNANYTVVFAENGGKDKFEISPYALVVTARSFNKTYGEADPAFIEDFVGAYDETINVTYTRETGKDIGTYSFASVTLTEPNANYTVSFALDGGKDKFVITPYALTMTASAFSKIYGEADPAFTGDFTGAYDETINVTYTREAGKDIGTYSFVSVTLTEPNANYTVSFSANGGKDKFVITPYTLTVTANTFNKTYGEADPAFTEDFTGAYDEIVNVTYTREAGNNARVYSFTSVILTEPNANYTVTFATNGGKDKFIITPYALTMTASAFSKIYGEADPAFTEDFTGAYDETVNVTYTREAGKDVRAYSFVSVTLTEPNANYTVSFSENGGKDKFTISPYALTVTTRTFNKTYGEADPVFSEDFTGAYDETVSVTYTREAGNNARVYSFTSVILTEPNANYTVSFSANGGKDKFVITPYALVVTASAFSKIYGEADPAFTGDFNGAYDETVSVTYTREAGNNARVYSFTSVILTEPNANYTVTFATNGGKDKFIITPYALVVTANTFNKTYGEADPAFTEDFVGMYDETINVTYTREAGKDIGTYSFVSVTLTEPNANYTVVFAENGGKDKFVISPYALIVTASAFSKIYGEADPAFTGDFTGAYDETINVTYTRDSGKDAGVYNFTSVTQTEPNANYTVSFALDGGKDKFVITPYALIVTASAFSKIYGEADPAFTGDFNGAYDETINVTYTRETGKDIGTYSFASVTLTEPNANYTVSFALDGGKDKFVITPYALVVTASAFSKIYGEADPAFTGDFNGAYDETINVTYTRETGKDIGTYSFASVTLTEPNANYTVSFALDGGKDKFVITPYALVVTASAFSKIYGEADPAFTGDFNGAYDETINVTYTRETGKDIGTYSFVSVTLTEPNANYTVVFAENGGKDKFEISPYALVVTARSFNKTYGEADPAFIEDFVGAYDGTINVTYTRDSGKDAGVYNFTSVTQTEPNANYTVSFSANGGKDKFVITPYALVVTARSFNKTYGKADPAFIEDFVGAYDETINVTYTRETGKDIGTYSFASVTLTEPNANYTVSFALDGGKDKFVITPYALVVTASAFSKIYGEADPAFTGDFNGAYDETINVTYTRETGKDIGTYSFASVTLTEPNANYTVSFALDGGKDKFVITPYALVVTASAFSKIYGEADPAFTEDFVGMYDETINVTYTREAGKDIGTYSFVSVTLTEPNANYTVVFAENGGKDKFVITPYALTVTASAFNKSYGEADPVFSEDFTGAYDETVSVTYTREAGNNARVYSFTSVILTEPNANYTVGFVANGGKDKFVITPYALTVTASTFNKSYGEADPAFTGDFTGAYDEIVNVTYTREAGNNARVYSFTSVILTEPNANYTVSFSENGGKDKFTISPYALTVTASTFNKTYGEADPAFTEDFVGMYDETINVTYTREAGNNARAYSFDTISLTSPNANYTVSFALDGGKDKFVIEPYRLFVASSVYVKTYGGADPVFTETFEGINNEKVSVSFDRDKTSLSCENVGEYDLIYLSSSDNNYCAFFTAGGGKAKFEIIPLKIKVEIDNKTSCFDDPLVSLTWQLAEDSAAIICDDNLNIVLTKAEGTEIGNYVITGQFNNSNYQIEFINGIYTIIKGNIDMSGVRFNDKAVEYNAENQNIVIDNDTLPRQIKNVIYANNTGKDPGVYYAFAEFVYDESLYNQINSITAVLTILPRKLTVNFYEPDNTFYDGTQKTVRVDFNNIIQSEIQSVVPIITYNKTVIQPDYYEATVSIEHDYYVLTGETTFTFIIYKQEIKNEKDSEQDVIVEFEKGLMPDSKITVANLCRREEISSGPLKGKESKQTYEINIEGNTLAQADYLTLKVLIDNDYRFLTNLSMGKVDSYGNIEEIECTREGDYLVFNVSDTQGTYIIIGEGKGTIGREIAALAGSIAAIIVAIAAVIVASRIRKNSLKVLAEKLNAVLE